MRATVDPSRIAELEANPTVVKVWKDGPIAPFHAKDVAGGVLDAPHAREAPAFEVVEGMATCPIGTCDCAPGPPKARGNLPVTWASTGSGRMVRRVMAWWSASWTAGSELMAVQPARADQDGPRNRRLADCELGDDCSRLGRSRHDVWHGRSRYGAERQVIRPPDLRR